MMRSSIGSWTFGSEHLEQKFSRVLFAGHAGIDLPAAAHPGRRAAPPGQGMQGNGGGEKLETLAVELDLMAKRDARPVVQLERRVAENLGREG
jgi:hypothetical protein